MVEGERGREIFMETWLSKFIAILKAVVKQKCIFQTRELFLFLFVAWNSGELSSFCLHFYYIIFC